MYMALPHRSSAAQSPVNDAWASMFVPTAVPCGDADLLVLLLMLLATDSNNSECRSAATLQTRNSECLCGRWVS